MATNLKDQNKGQPHPDVAFSDAALSAFYRVTTVKPEGWIEDDQDGIKAAMAAQGLLLIPDSFSNRAMEHFYSKVTVERIGVVKGLSSGINAAMRVAATETGLMQAGSLNDLMERLLTTARAKAAENEKPDELSHHVNTVAVLTAAMAALANSPSEAAKDVLHSATTKDAVDPGSLDLEEGKGATYEPERCRL